MDKTLSVNNYLMEQLREFSGVLYEELDPIPAELIAWAHDSGLSKGKADLRQILAQQGALAGLLVNLLEYLHHSDEEGRFQAKRALDELPFNGLLSRCAPTFRFVDLEALVGDLRSSLPEDLLGRLYEKLTPQAERRTLGQHWTPQPIAELMTAWAIEAGGRVLDPATGSGRFVQAVQREYAPQVRDGEESYVRAYEISPLVLLIAQINAALANYEGVRLDFRLSDFLTAPIETETFDAVICNPPYTRHHYLSEEMKSLLIGRALTEFGIRPSGFTSLFVYFFIRALSLVKEGGRLAFITPSELYEASYSEPFKRILKENAVPTAIVTFDKSHQVFEGVDTAGCITLATRGAGTADSETALVEVATWPGVEAVFEAIEAKKDQEFDWGKVKFVSKRSLDPSTKWSNMRQMTSPASGLPQLSSIAKIVRGVATGANRYFCLSHEEARQHKIPKEYLRPVITQTRMVQNYRLDHSDIERLGKEGRKVWLFNCRSRYEDVPKEVRTYIDHGEQMKLHERSLLKLKKRKWYMVEHREPPPILFTYLGRSNSRFIYNACGAQALNVFLLVYPNETISQNPGKVKALAAILNASPIKEGIHLVGRSYGGDTVKLEPRELDKLPILDPNLLSDEETTQLNSLFDELCLSHADSARQAALDQEVARLILQYEGVEHTNKTQPELFDDLGSAFQ